MSTGIALKWQPITDLPENWQNLRLPELASLAQVWAEQHDRLKESQAVREFNERLRREWSIETGILERLYTIDSGITQLLIEQGIDAALIPHGTIDRPVTEVIHILQDHRDALDGLFDFVASRLTLTTSYIRQLHQIITRHQQTVEGLDQFGHVVNRPLLRGEWKKWPNNPTRSDGLVHEYCPPLQVAGEMSRLIDFYALHANVPAEVNAAWLHHRFTQIHPFEDGNGRVARALATIEFLQAGWFPLVVNRDQRADYIAALEAADNSDLRPLTNLFGQNAKRAFVRALSLSEDILRGDQFISLPRVVEGLVDVYETRYRSTTEAYQHVEKIVDELLSDALSMVQDVANQISQRFATIPSPPTVSITSSRPQTSHYYSGQIVLTAKDLNYYANLARRRSWVRLYLINGQKTHIVFSFHYLGKANRGVMACSGFVYFPETRAETRLEGGMEADLEAQFGETHRICDEPFVISYRDEPRLDDLKTKFRKWLEEAISVGLAEWAQRL